ncbi:conserved hypothetical protein [Arthrobacter sp. 9AX]|nr:conserved hypothetical protein [Arthrobacter sp. 9AX]
MSAFRPGGWLRRCFLSVGRGFVGVFDGGTEVSAAVEPSLESVRLQLAVWEQRI